MNFDKDRYLLISLMVSRDLSYFGNINGNGNTTPAPGTSSLSITIRTLSQSVDELRDWIFDCRILNLTENKNIVSGRVEQQLFHASYSRVSICLSATVSSATPNSDEDLRSSFLLDYHAAPSPQVSSSRNQDHLPYESLPYFMSPLSNHTPQIRLSHPVLTLTAPEVKAVPRTRTLSRPYLTLPYEP